MKLNPAGAGGTPARTTRTPLCDRVKADQPVTSDTGEVVSVDVSSTLFVIPCGGSKLPLSSPARSLYTGAMFRFCLTVVEEEAELAAAAGRDVAVRILSARYGLLDLDTLVEPYDRRMTDRTRSRHRSWPISWHRWPPTAAGHLFCGASREACTGSAIRGCAAVSVSSTPSEPCAVTCDVAMKWLHAANKIATRRSSKQPVRELPVMLRRRDGRWCGRPHYLQPGQQPRPRSAGRATDLAATRLLHSHGRATSPCLHACPASLLCRCTRAECLTDAPTLPALRPSSPPSAGLRHTDHRSS